jgi:hypothetical protein
MRPISQIRGRAGTPRFGLRDRQGPRSGRAAIGRAATGRRAGGRVRSLVSLDVGLLRPGKDMPRDESITGS